MSRLPTVITSTLRVICTQYCPHLLTPGILIPANTLQEIRLKYKTNTACLERYVWVLPQFILSSSDHFWWVGLRLPTTPYIKIVQQKHFYILLKNFVYESVCLTDYDLIHLIRYSTIQLVQNKPGLGARLQCEFLQR